MLDLALLDPNFTGEVTLAPAILGTLFDYHLESNVTVLPDPGPPIPALSHWGLIGLSLLLLSAMFLTVRRRGLPT